MNSQLEFIKGSTIIGLGCSGMNRREQKKYHLVAWKKVCQLKEQGGLGILDLDGMNEALLGKWIWKLFNSPGLW